MDCRITRFFTYFAATAFTLATLHAEEGHRPRKHDRKRGEHPSPADFISKYDTDKNRTIDFEEFSQNPRLKRVTEEARIRLFERLDKDKDGALTQKELKHPESKGRWVRDWLDEKGPIGLDEFRKLPRVSRLSEQEQESLFKHLDRNDDGKISAEDGDLPRRHRRPLLDRIENEKGVDFNRFKKHRKHLNFSEDRLREMFSEIDSNQDGILSSDERKQHPKPHKRPLPK